MPDTPTLEDAILPAWYTTCRVTEWLVGQIPPPVWSAPVPGVPTRTMRSIAAHLHNARCQWIRTLGLEHGIEPPARVDQRKVTPRQLVIALRRSGDGIASVLRLGCEQEGRVPPSRRYVWRNLPLDVGHVLAYFVAHEAHHRGQLVMAARQMGTRLPPAVVNGLWDWRARSREAASRYR